jgi:hypothetical protein
MRTDPAAAIQNSDSASGRPTSAEPRPVDVDRTFDRASQRAWCELVRDIVAAANSGGGTILVHGSPGVWPRGAESQALKSLTADALLRRIQEFTGSSFANVIVQPVDRLDLHAVRIAVGPALFPIGFTRSGTYLEPGDPPRETVVFPAGSFYFRHGDHSQPANEADLRMFFERLLRRVRRQWLRGLRRVVGLSTDVLLQAGPTRSGALPTTASRPPLDLQPVRIVDEPNAPVLQPPDVDRLYPQRLKDVVTELNRRAGRRALTTYDIQAARRQLRLDERPDFVFHLLGAGRRYSPAMVDWLWEQWQHDPEFFRAARAADQQLLRRRRAKPR